jgi:hypothetical protein
MMMPLAVPSGTSHSFSPTVHTMPDPMAAPRLAWRTCAATVEAVDWLVNAVSEGAALLGSSVCYWVRAPAWVPVAVQAANPTHTAVVVVL